MTATADFDTATCEHLTEAARACRILDMEGHGDMTLGHLSVREAGGHGFWMKRNQIGLGEVLGPDDFVLVDWDGQQIAGSGGRHSEWPIHSEIFRARADVDVVVHTHPFYASVFSAATEPLQPFTLDADQFVDVPRHEADVALITVKSEGEAIAHSLGQTFAMLLGNHGVVFCGGSIEHAVCAGIFLEKACKAHVVGRAANLKTNMPDRAVRDKRHRQISTPAHWQHSYRYFCRKLQARAKAGGGPAIFG
ncbi:MAG TPA: class II aldolase/adducin family protein [Xanthobacteraceae bacterium]|jgi:ribulose-5-phosphate 4-epimerase/fuculose-1-phosphate aldolase|nr:class II aldolase/adducin family protein [Xanthobacteraceae bacterium]